MTTDTPAQPLEQADVVRRLAAQRQHQHDGKRSPHKPLLVLLALGRLRNTGSSALVWSEAAKQLGDLIAEFGPASSTGRAQSAANPFTRLRSDNVWLLDRDVPNDLLGPLAAEHVTGQFEPTLESALTRHRELIITIARSLIRAHFPDTIAADVLTSVGLDPDTVLSEADEATRQRDETQRRRDPRWRQAILQAWDRQRAFCGDGQILDATVRIDAAHVRWFELDGPDSMDNGLAACVLHHRLFDRGVIGLNFDLRIQISAAYTARTEAGKSLYVAAVRARPGHNAARTTIPGLAPP